MRKIRISRFGVKRSQKLLLYLCNGGFSRSIRLDFFTGFRHYRAPQETARRTENAINMTLFRRCRRDNPCSQAILDSPSVPFTRMFGSSRSEGQSNGGGITIEATRASATYSPPTINRPSTVLASCSKRGKIEKSPCPRVASDAHFARTWNYYYY